MEQREDSQLARALSTKKNLLEESSLPLHQRMQSKTESFVFTLQEETTMDFGNEQRSRGTLKGFVKPAFFVAGWVVAAAMLATQVGSLRTDVEQVLAASMPVATASAMSTRGLIQSAGVGNTIEECKEALTAGQAKYQVRRLVEAAIAKAMGKP